MTLTVDQINVINSEAYAAAIDKAEISLCQIHAEIKQLKTEDSVFIASDLFRVILALREALE